MNKLIIKNLYAGVEGKEILKGVNLEINSGEVHVIMGPNGTGKSTLSEVIMGNPKYKVTAGEIYIDETNILELAVDERARAGLFLAMQYPIEIAGITNADFIRGALKSQNPEENESLIKFIKRMNSNLEQLKMDKEVAQKYLNDGFSGGEKKKNEILQMKMLKPKMAILDEIDSGLDVDALSVIGENLTNEIKERKDDLGILIITHYQRLLEYIEPTHIHIMLNGKIVETGGKELVQKIEKDGYEPFKQKYNIVEEKIENKQRKIGHCATNIGVKNANQNS